jgi:cytochrome c oxidase subunit 4
MTEATTHRPAASGHDGAAASGHAQDHASVATYVKIAIVLAVITAFEVGVIYVRALAPIIVPLLLGMAMAKFALVAMFFMHLRYDSRALSAVFVGPLVIAIGLGVALMTLAGAFLVFGR